jgi:hypothetical protein
MMYYENTDTGDVSWTKPKASAGAPSPSPTKQWQIFFTGDGIPYYFNKATGESKWHDPRAAETEGGDEQLASALDVTPAQSPRAVSSKKARRTSLSVVAMDDEDEGEEEDPYMINLLDFTPKRGSELKKKNGKSPAAAGGGNI